MKAALNPLLGRLTGYMQEELNRRRAALLETGAEVFDFGSGDPREPTPPFIREALRGAVPEVSQYPSVSGIPVLRKAVAGYLARRFSLTIDDGEILPCAGAKEALFPLPLVVCSPERPLC